jgi:hypothetical protein
MSLFEEMFFGDVTLEPFKPVVASSIAAPWQKQSDPQLHSKTQLFFGTIQAIYPPNHQLNRTKNQYEYLVSTSGDLGTYLPIHCVLSDMFGGNNDFQIFTLRQNQQVLVQCLNGSLTSGIIIGGSRNQTAVTDVNLGHHWMRRFNKITNSVTKEDTYYVKHDEGNEIRVEKDRIHITDNAQNSITLDKKNKKIIITDGSGETITIDKNKGTITVQTKKDLNLEVKGSLNATVKKNAKIKAKSIQLNGGGGKVVTTKTWKRDLVTGVPFRGVKNVKAG